MKLDKRKQYNCKQAVVDVDRLAANTAKNSGVALHLQQDDIAFQRVSTNDFHKTGYAAVGLSNGESGRNIRKRLQQWRNNETPEELILEQSPDFLSDAVNPKVKVLNNWNVGKNFSIQEAIRLLKGSFVDVLAILVELSEERYIKRVDDSKDEAQRVYQVLKTDYCHAAPKDVFDFADLSDRAATIAYGNICEHSRLFTIELSHEVACAWASKCTGTDFDSIVIPPFNANEEDSKKRLAEGASNEGVPNFGTLLAFCPVAANESGLSAIRHAVHLPFFRNVGLFPNRGFMDRIGLQQFMEKHFDTIFDTVKANLIDHAKQCAADATPKAMYVLCWLAAEISFKNLTSTI